MSGDTGRIRKWVMSPVRDDRVLPVTRAVGVLLAPALFVAAVILYGFPDRTAELFAWTINPRMTPLVMGAGYGVGVYYFVRVATVREWHRVALVFPAIAVFTWYMLAATLIHWANFNHDHVTFWIWAFLYVVSPVLVPGLWVLNQRTIPAEHPTPGRRLPEVVRWVSALTGVVITISATAALLNPSLMIEHWAWTVSPLTTRVLAGWFVLFGVVNLMVWTDPRWSAVRIPVQTQAIGFFLFLLGAARVWDDFDPASLVTWAVVGGLAAYLVLLLVLYAYMERQ